MSTMHEILAAISRFDGFLTVMSGGIVMDLENLLELSPSQQTTLFGDNISIMKKKINIKPSQYIITTTAHSVIKDVHQSRK